MSGWPNNDTRRTKYVYPTTYEPAPMSADVESRYMVEFGASTSAFYHPQPYADLDSYYGPPGTRRDCYIEIVRWLTPLLKDILFPHL